MSYESKNAIVICSKQENKLPQVEIRDIVNNQIVARFVVDFDVNPKDVIDRAKAFADVYTPYTPEPAFDEDAAKKLEQELIDLLG